MMSLNRCSFVAIPALKSFRTVKPRSASSAAGRSESPSDRVPQWSSACCHVISVPGTPTESPELTAWSNGSGLPVAGSMKTVEVNACGPVSRPSIVDTLCVRAS